MAALGRYFRLLSAFARFALANELAFRGNFLIKIVVELLWLGILLVFYLTLFEKAGYIAGWNKHQYLFFIGCYYAMEGLIETLFLENCSEFADLVRTGNLDQYLLKPIDEQFLVTFRHFDWSTAPKLLLGGGIMVNSLMELNWSFNPLQVLVFLLLFAAGSALAYCFLLMLTTTSIWFMKNQSLMEMWWLLTTVMRYPREIYRGGWAGWIGAFFWYLVPILLVINVPVNVLLDKAFDPWSIVLLLVAVIVMLYLSRRFFTYGLRCYRSASS